jgi:hypothetical protein
VFGFAATLYGTMPLPMPFVAPVSVIHDVLDTADHEHPVVAVTDTLPVVAACVIDRFVGEIDGVEQAGENEKLFEIVLGVVPPGPTALTRASNTRPGVGRLLRSGRKSTRITLPAPGVGLPRLTVSNGTVEPCGKIASVYSVTSGTPLCMVL